MIGPLIALLALVPLVAGTSAHDTGGGDPVSVQLCNGGEIMLDLGRKHSGDHREPGTCDHLGCHAGSCRNTKKVKRATSS